MMEFDPGFAIVEDYDAMSFSYGEGVFGPPVERRRLDDIRKSLRDPNADGPEIPYVVAMDVGNERDREDLVSRHLLYGAMIYSAGRIGEEPVRSQGHIHSVSASCGMSTPEVYEIWDGEAFILMHETAHDDPGRCFAVHAKAGQVVIVPPAWAHYTVNADLTRNMAFGAWCIRDFGFDYDEVRAHGGLAWFPVLGEGHEIGWVANEAYDKNELVVREARALPEFGLREGVPIYRQYEENHELFSFVTNPQTAKDVWLHYEA